MIGSVEISRVSDSATKLYGFEWVGVIKGNEIGNKIRSLGLEPEVEQ
jgi:hypothetical protein